MSVTDDFYVTLLSDENSEFSDSKNNKIGVFTNKLPSPLILNEKYKVALTEIYVPPFYLLSDKKVAQKANQQGGRQKRLVEQNDGEVFEIILKESDLKIHIENPLLRSMKGKHFKLGSLLLFFITRMQLNDKDDSKQQELFKQLTERFINVLNDLDLNIPYGTIDENNLNGHFYLQLPYAIENEGNANETFLSKEVIVPVEKYYSFENFMRTIIKQVPIADRKIAVVAKALVKMTSNSDPKQLKYFRDALETNLKLNAPRAAIDQYESVFFNKPDIVHNDDDDEPPEQVPIIQTTNVDPTSPEQNEANDSEMAEAEIDPQLGQPFIKKEHIYKLDNLHMLFIYTDIVEHSIYAHHLFKLLRIIPFYPEKVRAGVHVSFTNPEYYTVTKTFIDSISIIINNRGEELQFINESLPIYLKLHFKKV